MIEILSLMWASVSWIHIVILVVVVIAAILISRFGNLSLAWGTTKVSFGKKEGKRSCKDCILLILAKEAKHSSTVDIRRSSILRDQMNFVEQKMQEVTFSFIDSYNKQQKKTGITDQIVLNKDITLYSECFKNMLYLIKDEVRRSFKENGFHELEKEAFSEYIKDKTSGLISLGKNYMINHYPHQGMLVTLSDRFKKLDEEALFTIIHEVFEKAKEIRNEADSDIKELDIKFAEEIDGFVTEK